MGSIVVDRRDEEPLISMDTLRSSPSITSDHEFILFLDVRFIEDLLLAGSLKTQRIVSHFHFDDHGYSSGALHHGQVKPCCLQETKDHSLSMSRV